MIVQFDKVGKTEIYFADLVAVEPKIAKVREAYREKSIGATDKQRQDLDTKVEIWCMQHFGANRFNRDWFALFGTDESAVPRAIQRWEKWLNAQPLSYRKLYYDPRVVAACLKSEEQW